MSKRARHLTRSKSGATAGPVAGGRVDGKARFAWIAAAILALALWMVYRSAIDSPFLFDDTTGIETNESIVSLWPLVGTEAQPGPLNPPEHIPTSGRPLVNLSLALNYHFGQLDPAGYHVFNVVLHFMSALLLWAIIRRTLRLPYFNGRFDSAAEWLALAVAVLWAVHPLQTESVIYTIQRTELMMAFFYLATLYCCLRYWEPLPLPAGEGRGEGSLVQGVNKVPSHRATWLALATLACLAGMASKEVMVSAPLMMLLFDRTFVAGSLGKAIRRSWPLCAGLALGWALLAWLNINTPHDDSAGFHLGVPAYVWWFTQAKVLLMYLKLTVWPTPLLIHYEFPYLESFSTAWMHVLPVAMLGIATLLLLWRNRPVGFLLTAMFAVLSPTLVIPITTEMAAERRMYLPLAAILTLAVVGGYVLIQSRLRAYATKCRASGFLSPWMTVAAPAALLALVLGLASVQRLAAYDDPLGMWQQVLQLQPHNHMAHQNVGTQLYSLGRVPEAIAHYRQAIAIKPDAAQAHYNLALILLNTGKTDEAIPHFREAVRVIPYTAELSNNLGVALFTAGRNDEAIAVFRRTIELKPGMWPAHDNLGRALTRAGDYQDAIRHYATALELNPNALDVYRHLAATLVQANQPAKAIAVMERAIDAARSSGNRSAAEELAAQLDAFRAREANAQLAQPNSPFESASPSN